MPTSWMKTCAAVTAVSVVLLSPITALPQSLGAYPEYCQFLNGRVVCQHAMRSRPGTTAPYERWENGTPAQPSGSYSTYQYLSRLYNFPR